MVELLGPPQETVGERRAFVRYPFPTRAICHSIPIVTGTSCLATVRDISVAGIGLLCDWKFEVGTWLLVESLALGSRCLAPPTLRVVHTRKHQNGTWLIGCAFRDPINEAALQSLLAEAARAKAVPAPVKPAAPPRSFEPLEGLAQALFEESADALFIVDPETGQLLDANSMAQRLTGLPLRELLRMEVTDLFRSRNDSHLDEMIQASRQTRVFLSQPGYSLRTTQDGIWVPVLLSVSRLRVKPTTLGLVTARDVRAQQEALAQSRKTEADLRRLLDMVPDCFWAAEIDPSGQWSYRYFSPGIEKITGQPQEHFGAGIHRWWSMVHPDDQACWEKALVRYKNGQSGQEEYRIVRVDAAVRRVQDSVTVRREGENQSLWLAGVITDITDR
jgi:PAS domain S-box-containing protein